MRTSCKGPFWKSPAVGTYSLNTDRQQSPSNGVPDGETLPWPLIKFRVKPAAGKGKRVTQPWLWKFLAKKINGVPGSQELTDHSARRESSGNQL